MHNKCVRSADKGDGEKAWCPTKVDSDGNIMGDKNWGFCGRCGQRGCFQGEISIVQQGLILNCRWL